MTSLVSYMPDDPINPELTAKIGGIQSIVPPFESTTIGSEDNFISYQDAAAN